MKKLILVITLLTFFAASAFASSENDNKGFKILMKNAGTLQLNDAFSNETFLLSDMLADWMTTNENELKKTVTNTCTDKGQCTLNIYVEDKDPDGGAFESSMSLDYNVDLKTGKMKSGYKFFIAG
jgi:hypothetical protein